MRPAPGNVVKIDVIVVILRPRTCVRACGRIVSAADDGDLRHGAMAECFCFFFPPHNLTNCVVMPMLIAKLLSDTRNLSGSRGEAGSTSSRVLPGFDLILLPRRGSGTDGPWH